MVRVTTMEVKSEATMPTISEVAKPRTGPVPVKKSTAPPLRAVTGAANFSDGDGGGQRAGFQDQREGARLLQPLVEGLAHAAAHGDARRPVGDLLVDVRRGVHVVIEHDGHAPADVFLGEVSELAAT